MKKRLFVLLLLVGCLLIAGLLFGCAGEEEAVDDPVNGGEKTVLVMGTNADFAPFEFIDENNEIVGFDIDLAEAIAEILGMELQIEDMDFGGLVAAVASGRIDIAVAAMTIRADRLEEVNFSDAYYIAGQTIVVLAGNDDIQSEADLMDKRIAVQLSTTGDFTVTDMGIPDEQVTRLKKVTHVFMELQNGRVDAVVIDIPVAQRYTRVHDGLKIIAGDFEEEHFGIAVPKDNTELLNKINDALRQLKEDGTYDRLIEKWFEEVIEE